MRRLLIALTLTSAPAAAEWREPPLDGYYEAIDTGRGGRTYVYFGAEDRRGPRIFSRDDGYFDGRGGGVNVAGGQATFDYDRDYPYDIPARWAAREDDAPRLHDAGSMKMCSDEPVRDRRSGAFTTVRVCR